MSKKNNCFTECSCNCNEQDPEFDNILKNESKFVFSLSEICHNNIAWFVDSDDINESLIKDWEIKKNSGLYILWHKNDYCEVHNLFHMKALYVGKGKIETRLIDHFNKKNFKNEMIIYFTHIILDNRKAKYVEQLFLDIFNFPMNSNENTGRKRLCQHFTQTEVD